MGIFARCFEVCYDFVAKGGLKKMMVTLVVLMLIGTTAAYLVYPQTTTNAALSIVGATPEGQFAPPGVEGGNQTVEYVGTFSGTAGPVGTGVRGDIQAEVNFETGEVSATADGDRVSGGFLEGEVDTDTGETWGVGSVNAFGLSGVPFEYEGEYSSDGSTASGTWEGTGEISGGGTWEIERVEGEEEIEIEEPEEFDPEPED